MNRNSKALGIVLLCVGLGAAIASGAGIFLRGEPVTREAVSIRGERYEYRDSGVYRYTAERVIAEGIGWDLVTLGLAVPAFFLILARFWILTGKNRLDIRIHLILLGSLFYFLYQYLEYAMFWALGPLFPLHVFLFSASLFTIIALLKKVQIDQLPAQFDSSFPFKGIAFLSGFVGGVLILMWVPFVMEALQGKTEGKLYGSTTLVVQALDLGLIVPLVLWTTYATWKKQAVGYLLSFIVGVKGVLMGAALCAMLLNVWGTTGKIEVVPLVLFGAVMLVSGYLLVRIYRSYRLSPGLE